MSNSKILVVGSGFTAASVAFYIEKYLSKLRQSFDLIHLSERKYYFYPDLICDLLSNVAVFGDIVSDFRGLGIYKPGVSFIESKIISIDPEGQIVRTEQGDLSYDYLILAIDACDFIAKDQSFEQKDIFNCITPFDVLRLKERIWKNLEKASSESKLSLRKQFLTFSIIGADANGIQIACSLADFISHLIKDKFSEIKKSQISIALLDEKGKIDLSKNRFYNARVFYNLNKRNISLRSENFSKSSSDPGIIISSRSMLPSNVLNSLSLAKDSNSKYFVDLYLKAENYNNLFIIGEKSICLDAAEKPQSNSIYLNMQAKICADNVISMINNNPLKPLKQKLFVEFMPIGYRNCLITIKNFSFDGLFAWVLFRVIHSFTCIGIKSKINAFLKLLFSLINPIDTDIFLLEEISEHKREKVTI